jgi:hypothetical protein
MSIDMGLENTKFSRHTHWSENANKIQIATMGMIRSISRIIKAF